MNDEPVVQSEDAKEEEEDVPAVSDSDLDIVLGPVLRLELHHLELVLDDIKERRGR